MWRRQLFSDSMYMTKAVMNIKIRHTLSTLANAPSSHHTKDWNSCPPDLELRTLSKWLASQIIEWMSRQASLHSSLQFHVGTSLGCREVLPSKRVCRARESARDMPSCERFSALPWHQNKWVLWAIESASDVPSCKRYTARQTVCYSTCQAWHDYVWVTSIKKIWP